VGYKVGSFTAILEVTDKHSRLVGKEKSTHATVLEVPPLLLRAVRVYLRTPYGSKVVGDFSNPDKIPELTSSHFTRLIMETQPALAGFPQKKGGLVEVGFGGDAVEFAKTNLNKPVKFSDFLSSQTFLDTTAVTTGHGLQGVIKRYGVPLLPAKTEKSRRKIGSLGTWTPKRTDWRVAMAGQVGYHARTEYNKEVLLSGSGSGVNPKKGWPHYGLVKTDYVILKGSVAGPAKRPIWLRKTTRPGRQTTHQVKHFIYENEVKKI